MLKKFKHDDLLPVNTTAGKVKGFQMDGTYVFRGIPYAKAKRFQAAEPYPSWEGIRNTVSYGYTAPQILPDDINSEIFVPHRYWAQSEDCLTLNIWTKNLDSGAKKPVLVWLHGGAFMAGSSIEQVAYDGTALCEAGDVVVVTVNHRVNILGYLDLSPFGEKYKNSGNNGQADIVMALKWVRDNIAGFGGDPDNVTLWGQSGGGMKASALMQTPEADGLFHKAVIMSGVAGDMLRPATGDGREIVTALLNELNLSDKDVEKLEEIPFQLLAKAYLAVSGKISAGGGYVGGAPLVGDYYLGEGPAVGFTEHALMIPMMVGTVYSEFLMRPLPCNKKTATEDETDQFLRRMFGDSTAEIKALFSEAYPDRKPIDLLALDTMFRLPAKEFIRSKAGGVAPVYSYLFSLDFPYENGKSAWHCSDIPFFFHNTDKVEICGMPGITEKLEQQMSDALIHFAYEGNPNHDGIPKWEPSTSEHEHTMIFSENCRMGTDFDDRLLEAYGRCLPPSELMKMISQEVPH